MTTCQMLARGLKYESGSPEDTFARLSIELERRIEYTKTLALVNAIIGVGNHIAAAVSQSSPNKQSGDKLAKTMDVLKSLLLPEEAERTDRDAGRAKVILEREVSAGPIKFRSMGHGKDKKGKVKLRV